MVKIYVKNNNILKCSFFDEKVYTFICFLAKTEIKLKPINEKA